VCGGGHLAAATRAELVRLGIHRDTDYQLPSLHPPLVIACGDSETDACFDYGSKRAWDEGGPLLLACLVGHIVRIGPLIEPDRNCHTAAMPPEAATTTQVMSLDPPPAGLSFVADATTEPRLTLYARLGALLVSAQALNFLLGARNQCVLNRVMELNPWSIESKAYKVLKVRQ
jgi:hypothetical protein